MLFNEDDGLLLGDDREGCDFLCVFSVTLAPESRANVFRLATGQSKSYGLGGLPTTQNGESIISRPGKKGDYDLPKTLLYSRTGTFITRLTLFTPVGPMPFPDSGGGEDPARHVPTTNW